MREMGSEPGGKEGRGDTKEHKSVMKNANENPTKNSGFQNC